MVINTYHRQTGIPVQFKLTSGRLAIGEIQWVAVGGNFFADQRNRLGIIDRGLEILQLF